MDNETQSEQYIAAIEHPVEFRGNAKEYFGIWIVNVLLSVATLGIYGAWAKVRDKKYFYGNTFIDNQSFSYHATGKQIFIGRLIVLGVILFLTAVSAVAPILYIILLLVLVGFVPWLICRAIKFNARVSSYRNVRFNFDGGYGGAITAYFLLPIASVFTLYFLSPVVSREQHSFAVNGHEYGNRRFKFNADTGPYFKAYFSALGLGLLIYIIAGAAIAFFPGALQGLSVAMQTNNVSPGMAVGLLVAYVAFIIVYATPFIFYMARMRNLSYNNTTLDDKHRFLSEISAWEYIKIVITNAMVVVLTIGLMSPWARVRLAKYIASRTTIFAGGPLDVYSGEVGEEVGVVAGEYADFEGLDIGITI